MLQIKKLAIPKHIGITDLFAHFSQQHWAILLDSSASQHSNAMFDIMVAQPAYTITSKGDVTEISHVEQGQIKVSHDCPIKLLAQYHAELFTQEHTQLTSELCQSEIDALPFKVGALGYFGYDLGRRFEVLPNLNQDEYQSPDMAVGLYTWSVIRSQKTGDFYFCYLDDHPAPSISELVACAQTAYQADGFKLRSAWQANMSADEYQQGFAKIENYLLAGDCYQVNFAQRFSAHYQGDEWQAYLALRAANQAPFSAFMRLPCGSILSISPERFLSVKDKQISTKPIKGTRSRSVDPKEDDTQKQALLASEKDRAENLMIVDLLRNDLSRNSLPSSVKVPKLFDIESFPAVHHLVSTVTAELASDKKPFDLLRDAFPGGSITGAPKIRAMQIIEELEPHRRHIYCGSIGYVGIDLDMDTNICIRTLLCENNTIYCWAGGGIVADSQAEMEYQESLDKVSKILPILEHFNE